MRGGRAGAEAAGVARAEGACTTRVAERKKQQWLERRQLREAAREQADRAARERAERNRADHQERFRLRDPIHIYALAGGADGRSAKDWTLILDSHRGAHSLELSPPSSAKAAGIGVSERPLQRLRITEHSKVFEFELCAHPRACAPLAARPSFQASCARASEAEARGSTGAPLPLGKAIGRPRRGKGVAPPPPSFGWGPDGHGAAFRAEIERRSRARWAGQTCRQSVTQISVTHAWASLSRRRDGHGLV